MIKEIWKKVPDFENYEVSNLGRVKSLQRKVKNNNSIFIKKESILKNSNSTNGYLRVNLYKNKKVYQIRVHQLVAMAFLNYKRTGAGGLVVDHINNIKTDNRLENLQIITHRENCLKDRKRSCKYFGITKCKKTKKFRPVIQIKNKNFHLGLFKNPKIAHAVYLSKLESL